MNHAVKVITLLLSPLLGWSAPLYTSTSDGDWTNGDTWDIGVPTHNKTTTGDSISIGSYVTLTDLLDVKTGTTIIVRAGDTLKIDGNAIFGASSVLVVEAGAVLWVTGNVTNLVAPTDITVDGTIIINGNYDGGNGTSINGSGSMDIDGNVNTTGSGSVFGSTDDCNSGDCSSSAGAPLPIDLVNFDVHFYNDVVQLKWTTATEVNNDFFTVKKSKNGKAWEIVSTVNGAGNSNQLIEYFETDYNPFYGISYYRLKQTDFDGKHSYSSINLVNSAVGSKGGIRLFPSPIAAGNNLTIELENTTPISETLVVLRDIKGQEFYSKIIIDENGNGTLSVPINNEIPSGTYLITTSSNDYFYSKKLIIQ